MNTGNDEPLDKIPDDIPNPHFIMYLGALAYLFRELPANVKSPLLERLGDHVDFVMLESGDNPPPAAIIDLGGLRIGVPRQVLHVLHGHVLAQQVGDHHDSETVRSDDLRQPCILEPSLEHLPHPVRRHGTVLHF